MPTFYIDRRNYENGVWTVQALDRCAFLDVEIDTGEGQTAWTKTDGKYLTSAFVGALREQCGFIGTPDIPYTEAYIDCEKIDGMTFQSVLQAMAEAYCGFFCSPMTATLDFVRYSDINSYVDINTYSRINDHGTYKYGSVKVTNGSDSTLYGGSAKPRLEINNEFAKADGSTEATQLYQPLTMTTFEGWDVEDAVAASPVMPSIGGIARFAESPADPYVYGEMLTEADADADGWIHIGTGAHTDIVGFRIWGYATPVSELAELGVLVEYAVSGNERTSLQFVPHDSVPIAEGEYYDFIWEDDTFSNSENTDHSFGVGASEWHGVQIIRYNSEFIHTDKRITRAEGRFVGNEFILSMGQDIPDMGEINRRGLLQQKLDDAVSVGKPYGTIMNTRYQGTVLVPNKTGGTS